MKSLTHKMAHMKASLATIWQAQLDAAISFAVVATLDDIRHCAARLGWRDATHLAVLSNVVIWQPRQNDALHQMPQSM